MFATVSLLDLHYRLSFKKVVTNRVPDLNEQKSGTRCVTVPSVEHTVVEHWIVIVPRAFFRNSAVPFVGIARDFISLKLYRNAQKRKAGVGRWTKRCVCRKLAQYGSLSLTVESCCEFTDYNNKISHSNLTCLTIDETKSTPTNCWPKQPGKSAHTETDEHKYKFVVGCC